MYLAWEVYKRIKRDLYEDETKLFLKIPDLLVVI